MPFETSIFVYYAVLPLVNVKNALKESKFLYIGGSFNFLNFALNLYIYCYTDHDHLSVENGIYMQTNCMEIFIYM